MTPVFTYGPNCPNCQYNRGFVISGDPLLAQHYSDSYGEAMRTNDWESVPDSDLEYDTESSPDVVGVPFECARCACAFALSITIDDEGRIVINVKGGDDRPTGDEIVSWLDLPPRA